MVSLEVDSEGVTVAPVRLTMELSLWTHPSGCLDMDLIYLR